MITMILNNPIMDKLDKIINYTKTHYVENKYKKLINAVFIVSLLDISSTIIWSYIFGNMIDWSIHLGFETLEWNWVFQGDLYLFLLIKFAALLYIHMRFIYDKNFFNKKIHLYWVYLLIAVYFWYFINNLYVINTILNFK